MAKMSFIDLHNAFERWLETNHLQREEQLLWYKLIALFNKSGWSEWITVDNPRLMCAMQTTSEKTLTRWRDELLKKGLFEYKKGKKGSPNQYKICTVIFTGMKESINDSISESTSDSISESTSDSHIKTKRKEKEKDKKEIKKKSFDDVFVEKEVSETLRGVLCDFIDMRKTNKKPMTSRALEILIDNTRKLETTEEKQIAVLNQSIEHGWQSVYPLKEVVQEKSYEERVAERNKILEENLKRKGLL